MLEKIKVRKAEKERSGRGVKREGEKDNKVSGNDTMTRVGYREG